MCKDSKYQGQDLGAKGAMLYKYRVAYMCQK